MYSGSRFEESSAVDINPHILGAKRHETQALMVESELQRQFRRSNIFVIPQTQYIDPKRPEIGPCLRLVDAKRPKAEFNCLGIKAVKRLYPKFYGEQSVYVSVDDLTIVPKGDGLKYAVEQMLNLRYGHDKYSVEYDRHKWLPWKSSILIEAAAFSRHPTETGIDALLRFAGLEDVPEVKVPREVADFILELSRRFRPDMTFSLAKETKLWNVKADYPPGFVPV